MSYDVDGADVASDNAQAFLALAKSFDDFFHTAANKFGLGGFFYEFVDFLCGFP